MFGRHFTSTTSRKWSPNWLRDHSPLRCTSGSGMAISFHISTSTETRPAMPLMHFVAPRVEPVLEGERADLLFEPFNLFRIDGVDDARPVQLVQARSGSEKRLRNRHKESYSAFYPWYRRKRKLTVRSVFSLVSATAGLIARRFLEYVAA
jgi:hypothetical protein